MAGIRLFIFHLSYVICGLYLVSGSHLKVKQVNHESLEIDDQVYESSSNDIELESETNLNVSDDRRHNTLAGGPVSIDCLRCLCLRLSNCLPIGCVLEDGILGCGYFRLTNTFWKYCGKPGKDWRTCSNNLLCASGCVQEFMRQKAEKYECSQNCEGYSREVSGGPNGCNYPRTIEFWETVQEVPGCKGVQ